MRRVLALMVCLAMMVIPVRGEGARYVALTFDDGPSGHYTRQLLQGLEKRGVKATFFLCGYRMAEFPKITREIHEQGHEIGCHGYGHRNMRSLGRREIAQEIAKMEELLPQGCTLRLLRPPGGCCNDAVTDVAKARNLSILSWSVDPRDWATSDTQAVEKKVLDSVKDGDVVLLHDMSDSSVQAALDIVDALKDRGFRFVTVSELARLRQVSLEPGRTYRAFYPKG